MARARRLAAADFRQAQVRAGKDIAGVIINALDLFDLPYTHRPVHQGHAAPESELDALAIPLRPCAQSRAICLGVWMSLSSSNLRDSTPQHEIDLDRITVVVASDHVFGDLDGEAVILHLGSGVYYGLNSVGTRVWNLIQAPISASEIREVLLAEYEVESETCEKELLTLLRDLSDRGLIKMTMNGTS